MDKLTYNAPELALLLGISRSATYNLMHRADFPLQNGRIFATIGACVDIWRE